MFPVVLEFVLMVQSFRCSFSWFDLDFGRWCYCFCSLAQRSGKNALTMARLGVSTLCAPSTSRQKVEIFCVVTLKGATVTPERKTEAADSWNRLPVAVRVPAARRASKNASRVALSNQSWLLEKMRLSVLMMVTEVMER